MASRSRSGERGIDPRVHPGRDHTNSPPSTSSHPLDGGDGREPGMLGEWKAMGFDIMAQLAILKAIEIVGEAASRIGTETTKAHPDIP